MKKFGLNPILDLVSQGQIFHQVPALENGDLFVGPYLLSSYPVLSLGVFVPSESCVVIVTSHKRITLKEGHQWIQLPSQQYEAYTVSQNLHNLSMTEDELPTSDNWNVSIAINLDWEVVIPEIVTRVKEPLTVMKSRCLSAVTKVISRYTHDQLVGTPQHPINTYDCLEKEIRAQLKRVHHETGIKITQLSVQNLIGDDKITQPRREAVVSLEQSTATLQAAEAKGKAEKKEAEYELMVSQIQQQVQLMQDLSKQVYQERIQERQRQHERISSAMDSVTTIASGLFNNYSQEIVTTDFQAFPMIDSDSLVKIMETAMTELRSLALASHLDIEASDEEEMIKSFKRMLDELTIEDNGTTRNNGNKPAPTSTNKPRKGDINQNPFAEWEFQ